MTDFDFRAVPLNLYGTVGDDLTLTMTCVDGDGAPVDVSGYTFDAVVRRVGEEVETFTPAISGDNNEIATFTLTDAQTTTISTAAASWSLTVTVGSDTRQWLAGKFKLGGLGEPAASSTDTTVTVSVGGSITATISQSVGAGLGDAPSDGTPYARQDGDWIAVPGGGDMLAANALSELVGNEAAARSNIGAEAAGAAAAAQAASDPAGSAAAAQAASDPAGSAAAAQAAAEATAAADLDAHEAAADPHPGYLTPAEADAAYDALGAAAAAQAASQPLDSDLTTIAAANNGSVLAATTASFTTAGETKLDGIETAATVGAGVPGSTPTAKGDRYFDTTNNRDYVAIGTSSSADWREVPRVVQATNQTGTTYTLALADAHSLIYFSNASAVTVTIPTNASVAFRVGTRIVLQSTGAGGLTLSTTSITLLGSSPKKTVAQNQALYLEKIATDTWSILGGTAT